MTILMPNTAKVLSLAWLLATVVVDFFTPPGYGIATLYLMTVILAGDASCPYFFNRICVTTLVVMCAGYFFPVDSWQEAPVVIFVVHRIFPAGILIALWVAGLHYIDGIHEHEALEKRVAKLEAECR